MQSKAQFRVGTAIIIARALRFMPEPGRTLILSAENDTHELHRHVATVREFYGATSRFTVRLIDLVGDARHINISSTRLSYGCFKPEFMILGVASRSFISLLKALAR
jgi:hypothetical protein